jgi:hypothetical protein
MKITSIPGAKISASKIKILYQFRLSVLRLKPNVNQSEDYSFFYDYAKTSQQIFIIENKKKEIKGFYFCRYKKIKLPNKTFIRLEPEYGIIDKSYRGNAGNFLPIVKVMFFLTFRYPFYPIYFVGTTYPASYISLRKQLQTVFDSIEGLNNLDKAIFLNYANSINCTLKEKSYVYDNPTIPELSDEVLARYETNKYYARFNKLNPEWKLGKSLVIVCPVHKMDMIKRVFKTLLRIKKSK